MQVMYDVCFRLCGVSDAALGRHVSMLDEFLGKCLSLLRGTQDKDSPEKAGGHGCKEKVVLIAGITRNLELPALAHLVVDVWEQSYVAFHRKMRSPSAFGGFKPPHLRHEMAVCAVNDTVWYSKARIDPKSHLPLVCQFIERRCGSM